jgi:hypothetical protein
MAGQLAKLSREEFAEKLREIYFSPGNRGIGAARLGEKMRERGYQAPLPRIRAWMANQETAPLTVGVQTKEINNSRKFDENRPSMLLQTDTLYLPHDPDGSKFLLSVWDAASRWRDAEPMKTRTAETAARAFNKILERGPLRWKRDQVISVDAGKEFAGAFKEQAAAHGAVLRVGVAGDHRHVGGAESTNKSITLRLFANMNVEELRTGRKYHSWVAELPAVLKALNSEKNRDTGLPAEEAVQMEIVPQPKQPFRPLDKQVALTPGTKVRVALPQPTEGGTRFRAGDARWSEKVYEIVEGPRIAPDQAMSYLTNHSDRWFVAAALLPIFDKVEPVPGKEAGVPIRGQQAEPIKKQSKKEEIAAAEAAAAEEGLSIIKKIERPSFSSKKPGYVVKWTDGSSTWEARDKLIKEAPLLVEAFDKKHSVVFKATTFQWKKK